MQELTPSWPPGWATLRTGQGRRVAVLVGSVGIHAVMLGWLAVSALGIDGSSVFTPPYQTYAIPVEMEPRPMLTGETARRPVRTDTIRDRPATDSRPQTERPTAPAPRMAAAPPTDAPPPPTDRPIANRPVADPWRVQAEDEGVAIGQALRDGSVGCRAMTGRMSHADQARCDQQLGEAAARAGPPGPRTLTPAEARREAGFTRDGARALAEYESRRAPLNSGVGVVGPADCVGSNFGTGCAGAHLDPTLRQGATSNIRQGGNSPDRMRPIPGNE